MSFMFYGCSALKTLDLSNFKTDNVTGMSNMFNGCNALTSLTLGSNFKTDNVTNYTYIFRDCNSLLSLDLRNADKAVDMVKTGNFAKRGMVIYLPADADVSDAVFEENFVIKPDANSTSFARTFTSGKTSTLCLPFAVNTADVTAGTFYEFKGRSDDGKTVKFGKPASGSTEADKAYIFKPSTSDKVTFTGAAIDGLPELTEGDADGLYGVYTKKKFTKAEADRDIYYGWSAGNFVSIGEGATLNPGRAYLKLSQASGAKNILNAVFDDETTGISEVNTTADDNAPAYDLMGRRVGAGYKGIVIKNGKKILK
ncbi:MAG: BspA family leucine-rich repeat surface protein [Prevotella sp.]|nr:BspA family leucine-rich repeat surface protein [Prevotella sp.]